MSLSAGFTATKHYRVASLIAREEFIMTKQEQVQKYQANYRNADLSGDCADKLREYFSREEAFKKEEKALKALKGACIEILQTYGTDTNNALAKKSRQVGVAIRRNNEVVMVTLTEGNPVTTVDWKAAFLALARETGTDASFAEGYTTTRKGATTLAINESAMIRKATK
jgi:hypothetical protein